jgi:hypothetical protein
VRLRPAGKSPPPPSTASADWAADLRAHLSRGPIRYALELQFYSDEKTTPIEDGAVDWREEAAPYVTVASLTIGEQPAELAGFAAEVEQATFDPWQALAAHRPLGGIMRARKHAYFASQKTRGAVS